MTPVLLTKAEFDAKDRQVQALARDWADRECTSFDEAVLQAAGQNSSEGSIWQMPAIDSKRVVSLLVELEPLLGCRLPPSLIRRGGYATSQDLIADLLPSIRARCSDGLVGPAASAPVDVAAHVASHSSV